MTSTDATAAPLAAPFQVWRALLTAGAVSLTVSGLLLLALRVSTDPLPGSLGYELMGWVKDVATVTGSVLLALAFALRRLARR